MSEFNIHESMASCESWIEALNSRECYVREPAARIAVSGMANNEELSITRLDNAFRAGKECITYRLSPALSDSGVSALTDLLAEFDWDLSALLAVLDAVDSERGADVMGYAVRCRVYPGVRVFSPFHLDRLKPLKKWPSKWTVPMALRAIANGQYESFRCKGVYTDDYAMDNALNFRRGNVAALAFIRRVTERPSGWHVFEGRDNRVHINCHSFDMNELLVNLSAEKAA